MNIKKIERKIKGLKTSLNETSEIAINHLNDYSFEQAQTAIEVAKSFETQISVLEFLLSAIKSEK
jgi:hypothetical protein